MSLISYSHDADSVILRVKILDSSVSTGAGKTGLTSASSGLIISTIADNEATATAYTAAGSTIEGITTLGTYAAPTATKCRFKEVDSTNHPGVYEIQLADARFAVASAKSLLVTITGATDAADCDVLVPLTQIDPYDGTRGGLTALPNAAADAAGGLATSAGGSTGIDDLATAAALATVDSNVDAILVDTGTTIPGVLGTPAGADLAADIASIQTDTTAIVADTNELQTDWANGGRLDLIIDAILVDTAEIGAAGAGLTAIPWNASWDAEVQSECNDALVALGLDHLVGASVTGTDVTDNSIIAKLVSSSATADWDDFVNTTDSLQAVRDHIGDGTNLTEAGGDGDHLSAIPSAAAIWSAITDAAANKIADHVLRRSLATAAASSDGDTVIFRSLIGAVRKLVNKIDTTTTSGKLTIFEEDDTTEAGTQSLTTDAAADPITVADTD